MFVHSYIIDRLDRGDNVVDVANAVMEEGKKKLGTSLKLDTYVKCIKRVQKTYKNFKKSRSRAEVKEKIELFLNQSFDYPKATSSQATKSRGTEKELLNLNPQKMTAISIVRDMAVNLQDTERKLTTTTHSLQIKSKECEELAKKTSEMKEKAVHKQRELKRTRAREDYFRQKLARIETQGRPRVQNHVPQDRIVQELSDLKEENTDLKKKIAVLEYQNGIQLEQLQELENEVVNIFNEEEKRYTPQLQQCVHTLLENHISTTRVGKVIEACLAMVGKKANKLPSASTINNINIQRLVLSQKQLGEEVSVKENITLETDETSKYGTKFGVYAARDDEGRPYVMGLRELCTKSGKDTLDTFKDILWDLDKLYYRVDNVASQNLMFNIRNTMSDRAATELKFNELLEEYRTEILPRMVVDWEELSIEEQRSIGRLNNFFCGLHSLVHFAEVTDKSIQEVEVGHFDGNVPALNKSFNKKSESGVTRLIRTACKAFSYGGDAKSGCHGPFLTYIKKKLKDSNMHSLPLTPFRGSRFNILFHNAGVVYYFHKDMELFLEKHGSNQWVLHDLHVPFFIAGCKALGLLCKLITSPLWNIIERKDIKIMEMNKYYLQLTTCLEDAGKNTDLFMLGELLPFGEETYVKRDSVFNKLVLESEYDGLAASLLQVILPAMAKLAKKLFKDQLPGGIFENPTQEVVNTTRGTSKHNKFSETVFAYFDWLLASKPHVKSLSSEAYIMFAYNKTNVWLNSKSEKEVKKELADAYKQVGKTRRLFKQRQDLILQRKQQILQEKLQKAENAKKKQIQESILQTKDILYWGLWQTEEQVDTVLASIKQENEKLDALKAQLRFRKNMLHQKVEEKQIYNFTIKDKDGKRRNITVENMTENVKRLIRQAYTFPAVNQPQTGIGLDIVGRNVKHRFHNDSDQDVWYKGHIISQVPGFQEWFNITYDEDPAVYSYKLYDDYKNGDLTIIIVTRNVETYCYQCKTLVHLVLDTEDFEILPGKIIRLKGTCVQCSAPIVKNHILKGWHRALF